MPLMARAESPGGGPVFWPARAGESPGATSPDDAELSRRRYRGYIRRPEHYGWMGAYQFEYLLRRGLREGDSLLDIGCGSLRGGRLFIPYLLPGRYHGIEWDLSLIQEGIEHELGRSILEVKRPTFLIDSDYTCSAFDRSFDYLLAHSIFSHTPLGHLRRCLAEARKCMLPASVFAATFTPGSSDYGEERWGQATYRPETIASMAADAGLTCVWDEVHPYGQQWVLLFRDDRAPGSGSTAGFDRSTGEHVRIRHGPDGWPRSVAFRSGEAGCTVFRLAGPGVGARFHSDFGDASGWEVHAHGAAGGLDRGRYSSGDARDHLATEFFDRSEVTGIVFFSVRAKPDPDARLPAVSLQGDDFSVLGRAAPYERHPDGSVFMAGWVHGRAARRVRLLIQQPFGTTCRLLQAVLVLTGEGAHEPEPGDS
jgi:SAM-dependent methyltransferase